MHQVRTRFKSEVKASSAMAGPVTKWWGAGTLDSLARSLGMSETRAFQSGIRGLEQSPSGATFKRVVTVVLRYCYGGAPMWVAQRTVIEQLANAIRSSPEAGPVLKFELPVPHALRQVESPHLLAEDLRAEERFGLNGRWLNGTLGRDGKKLSAFLPGT